MQAHLTSEAVKALYWAGGVATTIAGSWIASKIRLYDDQRKAHLEELKEKVLIPIRDSLDRDFWLAAFDKTPALFVQSGVATHFDPKAKAAKDQASRGDVLGALYASGAFFKPTDPALLEDAKKRHFPKEIAAVEELAQGWVAHARKLHAWASRMAQEILDSSGLPAFPPRHNEPGIFPYVCHLRLAVFVYKRLFCLEAPAVQISQEYGTGQRWILAAEGTTAALGTREQVDSLVAHIDKLIESEKPRALELQSDVAKLRRQFEVLRPKLGYAIAARRLRRTCALVPFF